MKVTIDVDVPEGFEATGEYRHPERNEFYLTATGFPRHPEDNCGGWSGLILRKLPPPAPTYRAWKDRSEVPVADIKFIAFYSQVGAPSEHTYWWVVTGIGPGHIRVMGQDFDFLKLHNQFCSWSADGVTWHPCGVLS